MAARLAVGPDLEVDSLVAEGLDALDLQPARALRRAPLQTQLADNQLHDGVGQLARRRRSSVSPVGGFALRLARTIAPTAAIVGHIPTDVGLPPC